MMEMMCRAQSKVDAPNIKMGDPHNQNVVKAIFVEYNIIYVIEIRRNATVEVIDRYPPSSPFEDEGIAHLDISTLHVNIEFICKAGPIGPLTSKWVTFTIRMSLKQTWGRFVEDTSMVKIEQDVGIWDDGFS
jgi:hypothetical protein